MSIIAGTAEENHSGHRIYRTDQRCGGGGGGQEAHQSCHIIGIKTTCTHAS